MEDKKTITEKVWKHNGLTCKVLFVRQAHRCGYVGIGKDNPAYDMSYDGIPVSVHGGLTFADHKLNEVETPEIYWVGFDCAHAGDQTQYDIENGWYRGDHFWTTEEVIKETEDLADQLAKLTWTDLPSLAYW